MAGGGAVAAHRPQQRLLDPGSAPARAGSAYGSGSPEAATSGLGISPASTTFSRRLRRVDLRVRADQRVL